MPRRDRIQQAVSLLDPHARPKLEELVRAIRDVNPTARGLGTSEQSKRYALKTRLQSALIHFFGDQLTVARADDEDEDEDEGDFVLLRHLATGVDACHAKVSALDNEARRWVRWRLDLPVDTESLPRLEPARRVRELRSAAPADLVERGHLALAEFDFDEARTCFQQALRSSPADASAAEALMSLLVDHLASDEEALAIEVTLPASTRKTDPVRTLVAVALLRARRSWAEARSRTVELVAGSSDPRAAEVLADAAHAALDAGELEEAGGILARCKDARGEAWDGARARLAKLRADARAPEERALQLALAAEPDERVESMARELAARWPDSRVARGVLAEIASRRAARLAAEALAEADRCEEAGDLNAAVNALRIAVGHLADETQRGSVRARLGAIEARAAQQRAEALARDVLQGLPSNQALRVYVDLPPEAASIVRGQSALPALAALDELRLADHATPPSALVGAAVAWAEAMAVASQHETALATILPHAAIIGTVPSGRRFLRDLRREVDAARRQRWEEVASNARRALDAMDHETAIQAIDAARIAGGAGLDARVQALGELAQTLATDTRRFAELEGVAAYPTARAFAQRCAELTTDDAVREGWLARVERVRLLANVALRYEASTRRLPLAARDLPIVPAHHRNGCWLRERSSEIACVARAGSRVCTTIVDAARREIVRRCMVDIPSAGRGLSACATADGIWLLYPEGCLKVDYAGEPIDMLSVTPSPATEQHRDVEQTVVSADGRFLWLVYADRVVVVALREGPGHARTIPEPFRVTPARGLDVMVCVHRETQHVELRRSDASPLFAFPPPYPWRVLAAVAHPALEGVVLLSRAEAPTHSPSGLSLHTVLLTGAKRETRLRMPARDGQNRIAVATSRSQRRIFMTFERHDYSLVMAVRPEEDRFHTAYYIDLPPKPTLIGDMRGERVFALGGSDDLVLVELTADAPEGFPNRFKEQGTDGR